ncbi:MAG TPA: SAM-dependent methyltransferase [Clostridiaceae bacterium]|nr:SAM-dependent methyltransferase [Clostridiaceae bacterium]
MSVLKNSLAMSHEMVSKVVLPGDVVIDATAGNGNDTVFLASLVGEGGRVYSFDIQDQAISNTYKKVVERNYQDRVKIIKDGHQNLDLYVKEKVKAVMFNLGYLPGGYHSIATRGETTAEAVGKAMELLVVNGIISIVVYYGGDSGFEEKDYLMKFFSGIDSKQFSVAKTEFVNQANCPPIFVCIEKLFEK